MIARSLSGLLKKGDRVAVSNITGREASKVTTISQQYCGNVVAGWALGKAGKWIEVPGGASIPVFGQFEDMMSQVPESRRPTKVIVYSPPDAVYGDVKEALENNRGSVKTVFVITEHVSIEVTAKLRRLADTEGVDILGCNTLGVINVHDRVRVGAVGGDSPTETFRKGSACIISNSGNMVNTIASYLQSAGLGISYGISTGKDVQILTPLKELLPLAMRDKRTSMIVLYVEPGGVYELEAIETIQKLRTCKPILVYVAGEFAESINVSLGHAGAVVDGPGTSASGKKALFDEYFGLPAFDADERKTYPKLMAGHPRGIRVDALHDLVPAATALMAGLKIKRDFAPLRPLALRPWFVQLGGLAKVLPRELVPYVAPIPEPYAKLVKHYVTSSIGRIASRQSMRDASHASSNDGATPRIYGRSLISLMKTGSFAETVLLYWLGCPVKHAFEARLFDMSLMAALTNGPGTISAQGAKLSASAGNGPNTAMMTTLGSIGTVHGGNGAKAARLLIKVFADTELVDPYDRKAAPDLDALVATFIKTFKQRKKVAKEAGVAYEKVPCLGHPVFNTEAVNHDPRERVIHEVMQEENLYNVFLDFYHRLSRGMMNERATSKVHAVNVDAALTCVLMGIAWPMLVDKKITVERVVDLPFLAFALGRVAGGAGEYLDHRDSGTAMDMRVPVSACRFLGREQD
jgi:succinyl-CoA synthetase alpha subunit/citrate synthase